MFYSGLEHEQSRPDRGQYITIHYGNIDGSKLILVKPSMPYRKMMATISFLKPLASLLPTYEKIIYF